MSNYLKILDNTPSMQAIKRAVKDGAPPNHWPRFYEFFKAKYPDEETPDIKDYDVYAKHWPEESMIVQIVEFSKSNLNLSEKEFIEAYMIHAKGKVNPCLVRDVYRELKDRERGTIFITVKAASLDGETEGRQEYEDGVPTTITPYRTLLIEAIPKLAEWNPDENGVVAIAPEQLMAFMIDMPMAVVNINRYEGEVEIIDDYMEFI